MAEITGHCATCEYWSPKYHECEHPDQTQRIADYCPADYSCELYEFNGDIGDDKNG